MRAASSGVQVPAMHTHRIQCKPEREHKTPTHAAPSIPCADSIRDQECACLLQCRSSPLSSAHTNTNGHACCRFSTPHMNRAQRMPGLRRMYSRMGEARNQVNNPSPPAVCPQRCSNLQQPCMAAHAPGAPQHNRGRQPRAAAAAALPLARHNHHVATHEMPLVTKLPTLLLPAAAASSLLLWPTAAQL